MWSLFLIILMVSAEHEVYIDSQRSQTTVMINGNEYVSKPERIYHPIEIRDGVEMGYGNFEGPEVSEFRVHGDAYIDETLYVMLQCARVVVRKFFLRIISKRLYEK